ncbi:DUF4326 domain-containing protein [Micromonospora sp. NPDC051300]|uniref:DUF4326 domain-containing protein n=1 Tax=Micromonospora sp. NPDC051300 TaxID=3364286 RepID=UPI0037BE182C
MVVPWTPRLIVISEVASPHRALGVVGASARPGVDALSSSIRAGPIIGDYAGGVGGQPRVRVQGDLYHPVVPPGAVYVGRQGFGLRRSPWANPFSRRKHDRAEALRLYRQWLVGQPALVDRARRELTGKQLACWCRAEDPCHADVLADVIG